MGKGVNKQKTKIRDKTENEKKQWNVIIIKINKNKQTDIVEQQVQQKLRVDQVKILIDVPLKYWSKDGQLQLMPYQRNAITGLFGQNNNSLFPLFTAHFAIISSVIKYD